MEATREVEGFLKNIRPPRLEDAGLEDCALPPESIKEAFIKAATAVGSRATSILASLEEEHVGEGRCTRDPWPDFSAGSSDALVGIGDGVDPPPGPCEAEEGGGVPEVMGDEVAAGVTEAEKTTDEVVAGGNLPEGEGKSCVDGLQGLGVGGRERREGK